MKNTPYTLVLAVLILTCGHAASAGEHFTVWTQPQWTNWMASVGMTSINTKNDGLSCDIMGQAVDGQKIIVNFAADGGLKDFMVGDITLDLSSTGRLNSAATCMAIIKELDGDLHAAFEDVLWNDQQAAMFGNTQKHPWGTNGYVIGITTANKFWLERR